ncbi:MAG: metal-dependent hydrolase [Luteolibacter sp.]
MDSVTHVVMGAAIGEALLGRKLGNRALVWGAFFGSLPDIDVLFGLLVDTSWNLILHRGVTHSLFAWVAAIAGLSPWLAKLWKKDKVTRGEAAVFIAATIGSHLLLDCLTAYGTKLFAPFSNFPVAFNCLFIIDPFVTLPLLVTVGWLAFLKKKDPKRRKLCLRGLMITAIYIVMAVGVKFWISSGFEADLQRRQVKLQRRMEAPTVLDLFLWRSVVDRGDEFWIGYRSLFESSSTPVRWVVVPKGTEYFAPVAGLSEAQRVDRFSDGWWVARPTAKGVWIADMRFGEMRAWERKATVDLRPPFSWQLIKEAEKDRLRKIQPEDRKAAEHLKRLALRVFGNRADWEGNPRLTGNPGSLPEILEAVE